MERNILFRGKQIDTGEWVEGIALPDGDGYAYIIPLDAHMGLDEFGSLYAQEWHMASLGTVCQYTGREDKDGRKIFEGDIARDIFNASVVGIVRYGEYRNTFNDDGHGGHVGFYIEWKQKQDLLRKDLAYWAENSEFIGNIFDNPELIERHGVTG